MLSKFIAVVGLSLTTLTAYPAIIAKAMFQDGAVVFFTDEQRTCKEGWLASEYVHKDVSKKPVKGCYMPTPSGLYIEDEEGDKGTIPWQFVMKPDKV